MKDFHELKVWQKAHQLTLAIYQITAVFPREELYGLTSQLRRCSSSIPANLAEGCGRNGDAEFARFCSIAYGIGQRVGVSPIAGQRSEADQAQGPHGIVTACDGIETHAHSAASKAER